MTYIIPTGEQSAFLPQNCDNTGGGKALKNQASIDANYQNTGVEKVCCGFRDTEKDKAWLALSMLTSWGAEEQFQQR